MMGGWSQVPSDDFTSDRIQSASKFAVKHLEKSGGGALTSLDLQYDNFKITSVEQQVVAGMNYKFVIEIPGRECLKHEATVYDR